MEVRLEVRLEVGLEVRLEVGLVAGLGYCWDCHLDLHWTAYGCDEGLVDLGK